MGSRLGLDEYLASLEPDKVSTLSSKKSDPEYFVPLGNSASSTLSDPYESLVNGDHIGDHIGENIDPYEQNLGSLGNLGSLEPASETYGAKNHITPHNSMTTVTEAHSHHGDYSAVQNSHSSHSSHNSNFQHPDDHGRLNMSQTNDWHTRDQHPHINDPTIIDVGLDNSVLGINGPELNAPGLDDNDDVQLTRGLNQSGLASHSDLNPGLDSSYNDDSYNDNTPSSSTDGGGVAGAAGAAGGSSYSHHVAGGLNQTGTPTISTSLADPIINVVAPDDFPSESKHYVDEAFPMYSADGIPIHGSQMTEFQPLKSESGPSADYSSSTISPSLASPISPSGSSIGTPYGTPQGSPLMIPNRSTGYFGQAAAAAGATAASTTPIGSPLADGPYSPYENPPAFNDGGMSPLIDDEEPFFDPSTQMPYFEPRAGAGGATIGGATIGGAAAGGTSKISRNNSLGVPRTGRKKSRSASDSWNSQEREALLESLDAQTQLARSSGQYNNPNFAANGPIGNGPVGAGYLMPEAFSQIQFPTYTPVNVRPHSPKPLYAAHGSSTSGDSRGNSSSSSVSSSGAVSPAMGMSAGMHTALPADHHYYTGSASASGQNKQNSSSNGNGNGNDTGNNGNGNGNNSNNKLAAPTPTRGRSLSSPYEPTNDLKATQMFSCELCGKKFTRAYNLRSHMRTHTDERPFACKHCGKAFARQHDRKRHEALHSGEKRFVCYGSSKGLQWGCRKRFARADALGRHFRTEAGKNCLRPLIERILANGSYREGAPEGILFTGFVNNQPQLVLTTPERDSNSTFTAEEREEQTRRTVIVAAVIEQFQELVGGPRQ